MIESALLSTLDAKVLCHVYKVRLRNIIVIWYTSKQFISYVVRFTLVTATPKVETTSLNK